LGDDRIDGFDDLFEPFNLQDGPPPEGEPRPSATGEGPRTPEGIPQVHQPVACPSCGSGNPPFNRHCEACGARLSQAQLPVAGQPMLRTTAGARALMVLAGIILAVAVLALAVNVFGGGEEAASTTTSSTTTTVATLNIIELSPVRTECTSELAAFPCTALTDEDADTYWNATDGGVGAELTFLFSPPVQITEMFIYNVEDQESFLRNARMKGIEIEIDDLTQAIVTELADTNEPQKVQVRSLGTSRLTLRITSAYPGQTYEDKEPFRELAAREITFFGRVAPQG
jgi:hypothetical protein